MEIEEEEVEVVNREGHREAKVIALFNHKGGVGKTTSTMTLGWKLARRGNKVLLVDADPQCNLTGFLIDPGCELAGMPDYTDPLELFYTRYPQANMRSALAPILGELHERQALGVDRTTGVLSECYQLSNRNEFLPQGVRPFSTVPDKLYLLAGHPLFSEYDPKIALAASNPEAYPTGLSIPGCFRGLFDALSQAHGFDYILVDLSPSASATNKLIILSSDFLVIPCSPDFFSHMAIQSMCKLLIDWDNWKVNFMHRVQMARDQPLYHLPTRKPILLGHTIQLFTVNSGRPAFPFQRWMTRIADEIRDKLLPVLRLRGMAFENEVYGDDTELARIRNFQSMGPAASKCHVPFFELSTALGSKAGANSKHMKVIKADVDRVFNNFATTVETLWDAIAPAEQAELLARQSDCDTVVQFRPGGITGLTATQIHHYANLFRALQRESMERT